MHKNLVIAILIVVFLVLFLIIAFLLTRKPTSITGKASSIGSSSGIVEMSNSYIFASPLIALSGGEKIRITVFLLDSQGKGVFGKYVSLGQNSDIKVDLVQPATDDTGKVIFDISSFKPGLYVIEAQVDGVSLPQRVNVTFR